MRKTVAHSFPCNGTTSSYPGLRLVGQGCHPQRDVSAVFRREKNFIQAVFRNEALRRVSKFLPDRVRTGEWGRHEKPKLRTSRIHFSTNENLSGMPTEGPPDGSERRALKNLKL